MSNEISDQRIADLIGYFIGGQVVTSLMVGYMISRDEPSMGVFILSVIFSLLFFSIVMSVFKDWADTIETTVASVITSYAPVLFVHGTLKEYNLLENFSYLLFIVPLIYFLSYIFVLSLEIDTEKYTEISEDSKLKATIKAMSLKNKVRNIDYKRAKREIRRRESKIEKEEEIASRLKWKEQEKQRIQNIKSEIL